MKIFKSFHNKSNYRERILLLSILTFFIYSTGEVKESKKKDNQIDIAISLNEIFFNNHPICSTSVFINVDLSTDDPTIYCLYQKLLENKVTNNKNKIVNLQFDKNLPFLILFITNNTIAKAGYERINFAVQGIDSNEVLLPNSKKFKTTDTNTIMLCLLVKKDSIGISYKGKTFEFTYYKEILNIQDVMLKKLHYVAKQNSTAMDKDDVIIAATDDIEYDKIVQVMNIARYAGFLNIKIARIRN